MIVGAGIFAGLILIRPTHKSAEFIIGLFLLPMESASAMSMRPVILVIDCCGLAGWEIPWDSPEWRDNVTRWRDSRGLAYSTRDLPCYVFLYSCSSQPTKASYEAFMTSGRDHFYRKVLPVCIDHNLTDPCHANWDAVLAEMKAVWSQTEYYRFHKEIEKRYAALPKS